MSTQSRELPIGPEEVRRAAQTLTKYKQGKAHLEQRIVEDELWWKLRHWEVIRGARTAPNGPEPSSAWLFNAILNKHADAMDNYPEPVVLPREPGDAAAARTLSQLLPVLLEAGNFEQVYSDNWWEKLKHGTAAYGVFWNARRENGLGDVDVRRIDLLKLFWEPGVTDIQDSRDLFVVELVDEAQLEEEYPQHAGRLGGSTIDVKQYVYDDAVDTQGKSVVVDWYYKVRTAEGRTLLHYAKFVGETLLFASENEPDYRETGWYAHGLYPVVLDVLFPEKGTPAGFGYVAVCKDPQMYIDRLSANLMENALLSTKKRFFISESTAVNEEEFLDAAAPLVHVAGELDERRIREIVTQPVGDVYVNFLRMKIEELNNTAANRDVNAGGTLSGVTAASAIAALQEAGNKVSRDMIGAAYRVFSGLASLCIELIRQFYDESRSFRITGEDGGFRFVEVNNAALRGEQDGARRPVFDLKIRVQRKNPFSRMEQNERAKELYAAGFFNPERAQEALGALEMMDFEGIDAVRARVRQGAVLARTVETQRRQLRRLAALAAGVQAHAGDAAASADAASSADAPADSADAADAEDAAPTASAAALARSVTAAQTPQQGYVQRLAKRSV